MSENPNPFMPTGELLLSMSTCSVIATGIADRLATRGLTYGFDLLDAIVIPDDPAVLLDADQVGKMLAVSPETVYNLARRHEDPLPSRKIGRSRRFVRDEVDAWSSRQK